METPRDTFTNDSTYTVAVVGGVAKLHGVTLAAGTRLQAIVARTPRAATTS
ncbi:MAG: hypothetical protein JWN72_1684 [Thermoleophilia bacterium]|nr:hypothetical protein [Thermoleophilia bacterium]